MTYSRRSCLRIERGALSVIRCYRIGRYLSFIDGMPYRQVFNVDCVSCGRDQALAHSQARH